MLESARKDVPVAAQPMKTKPNVVVAIMESMGRDTFDLHSESCNTLGSLVAELSGAVVFRNGISVNSGTFPSLEGILFDSLLTPLTQSRYGRKTFDFSRVNDFKKEGYKTVFLSAGNESWRQVDVNFPLQGFDEIIGANAIQKRYPQVKISTWGLGDAWMFKAATEILKECQTSLKLPPPFFFLLQSSHNAYGAEVKAIIDGLTTESDENALRH